eukprot:TCONS_00049033-protein
MGISKIFICVCLAALSFKDHVETANTVDLSCDKDLAFIVSSCQDDALNPTNFNASIDFVKSMADNFTIAYRRTQVSLITSCFTQKRLEFGFEDLQGWSPLVFKAYLNQMKEQTGGASFHNISNSLNLVKKVFNQGDGDRVGTPNVLVVILDKPSNELDNVQNALNSLQLSSPGIKILAVAIGDKVDNNYLYNMTGDRSSNVFRAQNASDLDELRDDVVQRIC